MKLADAFIEITGDDGPLGPALAGAKKKTQGFVSGAGSMVKTAMTGAVVGGVGILAAGVVGVGAKALNMANDVKNATDDIQSQFGLTEDAAQRLGDVGVEVFRNNFADSVGEAIEAVGKAQQLLGELNDTDLQKVTEDVFAMRDAFGLETEESMLAVKTLMEEFGVSSQQATDMLTAGMQNGLNANGDFLDSIGEYSNLFADAGFSAAEMYSIMETGAANGVLGTDKIGDAVKEMGLRLNEGGDEVGAAFAGMGLSFDDISAKVASGQGTWADYFPQIISGLNDISDPIERSKAQVAIFGTQAEDLGVSFTEGLSASQTAMEDMAGSTDSLNAQYSSVGDAVERMKRRAIVALGPVGDKLLELANAVMPQVEAAFEWFETVLLPLLIDVSERFAEWLGNIKDGNNETWNAITAKWDEFIAHVQPAIDAFMSVVLTLWELFGDDIVAYFQFVWDLVSTILDGAFDQLMIALDIFTALFSGDWAAVLDGIKQLWSSTWDTMVKVLDTIWEFIQPKLSGIVASITGYWQGIDWGALGGAIIDGIVNGISAGASRIADAARGAAQSALDAAKAALGINSPSKEFMKIGEGSGEGYGIGFENEMERVQRDMQGKLTGMVGELAVSMQTGGNRSLMSRDQYNINVASSNDVPLVERLLEKNRLDRMDALLAR